MQEMKDCWPFGVALRGGGFKPPTAALAEDCRGERCRKGPAHGSGGDQEDERSSR